MERLSYKLSKTIMNFIADHADDLMHDVLRALLRAKKIKATRGWCREVIATRLELKAPLCRLSQTESRGKIFSALGELLWYLSGSDELSFIAYYIKQYNEETEDGETIRGAYGPRLFKEPNSQWDTVRRILLTKLTSRRAVLTLLGPEDVSSDGKEIPCTVTLQFFVREDRLILHVHMRSNDAIKGLPHDIFAFTMLQEIMARDLGIEVGRYYHTVGSLHLYDDAAEEARVYLDQGVQEARPMPQMPYGSQWGYIKQVLEAERMLRKEGLSANPKLTGEKYWDDVINLLKIYSARKNGDHDAVYRIKRKLEHPIYKPYVRVRGVEPVRDQPLGEQLSFLENRND